MSLAMDGWKRSKANYSCFMYATASNVKLVHPHSTQPTQQGPGLTRTEARVVGWIKGQGQTTQCREKNGQAETFGLEPGQTHSISPVDLDFTSTVHFYAYHCMSDPDPHIIYLCSSQTPTASDGSFIHHSYHFMIIYASIISIYAFKDVSIHPSIYK